MFKPLTLLVFAVLSLPAFAANWGAGIAMEGRVQKEVNPDYADLNALGQVYAEMRIWPWAVLVEGGSEKSSSASGAFSIRSNSYSLGVWGHYEFLDLSRWSPFVASGVGSYFDSVETTLDSDIDRRDGHRMFFGLGAGARKILWSHLNLEAEARVEFVEARKDPYLSGLLRLGWQI